MFTQNIFSNLIKFEEFSTTFFLWKWISLKTFFDEIWKLNIFMKCFSLKKFFGQKFFHQKIYNYSITLWKVLWKMVEFAFLKICSNFLKKNWRLFNNFVKNFSKRIEKFLQIFPKKWLIFYDFVENSKKINELKVWKIHKNLKFVDMDHFIFHHFIFLFLMQIISFNF